METIVLSGGFGTRLSHIVKDVPKPMAVVKGKPFLYYILSDLVHKGATNIILAVGYKKKSIIDYFGNSFRGVPIIYSVEESPLLTGGAIKKALLNCKEDSVFIVNGDTLFDVDLNGMYSFHKNKNSSLTVASKRMLYYDRYGTLIIDNNGRIVNFLEKTYTEKGYINGGIYLLKKDILDSNSQDVFSFEKDFMEKKTDELDIFSYSSDGYFIDIGIEDDYKKVQTEKIMDKGNFGIHKAAFFDRDGTINIEKNYLYKIEDFEFRKGMPELIKSYNDKNYVVIVVTNQAGIARGYYTEEDMHNLHRYINQELSKIGAHIDSFYFCPHHPDFTGPCNCRKPKTGMIEKAVKDWNIDVSWSVLYGDKPWDIEAGQKCGIKSILVNI